MMRINREGPREDDDVGFIGRGQQGKELAKRKDGWPIDGYGDILLELLNGKEGG